MTRRILLADAGGTFTRLALADEAGAISEATVLESALFGTFEEAARSFLADTGAAPTQIAIAAAGPLAQGVIELTNGPGWSISARNLATAFGVDDVLLVNDFAGLAAGAPHLPARHLTHIATGEADPAGAIAVIGPGTGLGVALLAPRGAGTWQVLPGEGGHAGLSPVNDREIAILFQMIRRFGHVRAEFALSGSGLEILWETIAALDGASTGTRPTAGEISERARRGSCSISAETVSIFTGWLGGFAGDIALIAGATGGVYLAGGILPRWGTLFDTGLFRRRFVSKGTHRALMERIPVNLITDPQACFKGLLALLKDAA
jgi:glucokinase